MSHARPLSVLISSRLPNGKLIIDALQSAGFATMGLAELDLLAKARDSSPDVIVLSSDSGQGWAKLVTQVHDQAGWRKPMIVVLAEHADVDGAKLARDAGVHLYAESPTDPSILVVFLRRFQAMLADIEGFDPMI